MKLAKRLLSLGMAAALCMTGLSFPSIQAQESPGENLALGKTVLVSSEEGTSSQGADTHAENAVDGDTSTCWTAQTRDSSGDWDVSYPEWLCVDLGAEYSISFIEMQLDSRNGQRLYDYRVYASENTPPVAGEKEVPEGFVLLADRTDNTVSGVQQPVQVTDQTARYILVEILSCNQYNAETAPGPPFPFMSWQCTVKGRAGILTKPPKFPSRPPAAGTKATPRSWTAPGSLADGCSVPPLR